MPKDKLITTTIGSFPKPAYVPIQDWFDAARTKGTMNSPETTSKFTEYFLSKSAEDERLYLKGAEAIIRSQTDAGIDIPTDGEVRRENYIHYHCRFLNGYDFNKLETRVLRDGAYETDLPAIRGRIAHSGTLYSKYDFRAAQSLTSKPLKFTLPGPLTIMDTSANCFYRNRRDLAADLADSVNAEIMSLVEAGCKYIQVDEPLFARNVSDAKAFGLEMIERCFHGVPSEITRIIHICCGYPDRLDDEDYKKANPDSYHQLAPDLDLININQISIEDAHCCNDLKLLELFEHKVIIFGSIAVARSRLETRDEVVERILKALEHIDRNRLIIAPDCGLGFLTDNLASAKLRVMCEAAALC
ncbi:MAG: cobalamin-independent methionine synthase II family protein [Pseudomonadota bacterium]|nr:cobalamin-independent methionine synthase II family protein [Pseudomonadota bacterium]